MRCSRISVPSQQCTGVSARPLSYPGIIALWINRTFTPHFTWIVGLARGQWRSCCRWFAAGRPRLGYCRPRSDVASPSLGMARGTTRRRLRNAATARRCRQQDAGGKSPAGARCGGPLLDGDRGKSAGLRRGHAGTLRRRCREVSRVDGGLAGRHPGACPPIGAFVKSDILRLRRRGGM